MKKNFDAILPELKGDLLLFGKTCIPTMFSVRSPKFHREIAQVLQNQEIKRINIIAPRGHAKSSIGACLFPLHHVVFDPGPKVIVLVSRTWDHSVRLLQTIKDVLNYSIPFRTVFGYWGEHSAKIWKEGVIVLKDNTMIIARGTGQMIVGLKHGNQRPTLVVLDDPEDMNNTKTSEAMEFNLRWLLQALIPSLDPQRGRILVIGTPQHQRCMVEVLSGTQGWLTMRYQAIAEDGKTALWPEWMPLEKLMEEKAALESIGRVSSFYREYQCQIIGDEDQLFKENYIQTWRGTHSIDHNGEAWLLISHLNDQALQTPKRIPVNIFMGVDPASSTSNTADFSVILAQAIDEDQNRYILPYFRRRVTPLHLADNIMRYFTLYRPKRTRVESVGYQEMLREYLRSECAKRHVYISGLELKELPRGSKSHRIETLEPFFFNKKVYLQPDMQELRDELLLYPRGKHDDLLDGLYYASKAIYKPTHKDSIAHVSTAIGGMLEDELDPMLA